jgi:glycine cleavage system H lipoate-binding protein
MDAGVLAYRLCDRDFDCDLCPLDQALRGEPREAGSERLSDSEQVRGPGFLPPFQFRPHCFYAANHLWLRVERGGAVRVGLDDFGQQLLGQVYSVGLPDVGRTLSDESSVELVNQLGVFHPLLSIRGRVVWRNPELDARPALVNREPYGAGGFLLIEPDDLKRELGRRRFGDEASRWLADEAERLAAELLRLADESRPEVGPTLPDGGRPTDDLLAVIRREEVFRPVAGRFLGLRRGGRRLEKGE